jgi:predicted lipid-binding transport protein (Tim44 family)
MKKLKTLLMVGAVGGIVAAVAKKLQAGSGGSAPSWQSATDSRPSPSAPAPAPTDMSAVPDEQLVDNAPAPAELPDEPVTPEAAGPQSTAPIDERTEDLSAEDTIERLEPATPDPLTDPLPEVTGEDDQPRP